MKQHEQEDYVDFSKMSEAEIIMHHFKQFDHDKDGMVDGLEVLKQIRRQNGNLSILFITLFHEHHDNINCMMIYILPVNITPCILKF